MGDRPVSGIVLLVLEDGGHTCYEETRAFLAEHVVCASHAQNEDLSVHTRCGAPVPGTRQYEEIKFPLRDD